MKQNKENIILLLILLILFIIMCNDIKKHQSEIQIHQLK